MAFGFGFGARSGANTIWSPASLFAQNEPGVWYDPSDMTTLFQDAAGTTPVTAVEQPVGLMLDKSRGLALGSELITNGTFDTNLSGWTVGIDANNVVAVWSAGTAVLTRGAGNANIFSQTIPIVIGKTYKVSFDLISGVANMFMGGVQVASIVNIGKNTIFVTATNTATLQFWPPNNASVTIDNISVRELPGVHATSLTTSRPVLTARVNIFTETEFRNGVVDAPVRGGVLTATTLTGYLGALAFGYDGVTGTYAYKNFTHTVGISYTLSVVVQMTDLGVPVPNTNSGLGDFSLILFGGAVPTSITTLGGGLYRVTASGIASGTTYNWGVVKYATQSSRTFKVTAYSLTTADQASLGYQRVNTATDYDTVGFPMWLKADGVDDYMVTGTLAAPVNLNLSTTDKVTVVTGVRKLSDAAAGFLLELSANSTTSTGTFTAQAPASVLNTYRFGSWGNGAGRVDATSAASYASPISNVFSGIGDISGDLATLRINGTQAATSAADQGTGNYGSYPLYQFQRAGTSLPFNGLSAGLTVVGRTLTAAELSQLETYYQQKTKAY